MHSSLTAEFTYRADAVAQHEINNVATCSEIFWSQIFVLNSDVESVADPEDQFQHRCRIQVSLLYKVGVQFNGACFGGELRPDMRHNGFADVHPKLLVCI